MGLRCPNMEIPRNILDPQEIMKGGDILNKQNSAGPPGHMGQQKGSTEAQHLGGTTESSRAAECSGIASAECSLPYVAAIGAGRMGLRPQLAHMLAAHSACLKFISSVPVLQDECQGSLRAGGQRAQHSAWHTGGPQRMWSLLSPPPSLPGLPPQMASLRDEARPGFWLPNGLL